MTTTTRGSGKVSLFGQFLAALLAILMVGDSVCAQQPPPPQTVTTSVPITVSTYTEIVPNTQLPANVSLGAITPTAVPKPVPLNGPINTTGASGTNGACTPAIPATAIVQDCTLGNTSFESNMINLWLGIHGLPASDASLIYQYGGVELRSEIRSFMLAYLQGVIMEDPSQRSINDQHLFEWLQAAVENNEIAYYQAAAHEYSEWQNDPCNFQLNTTVANSFGISYDGEGYCAGAYQRVSTPLPGPDVSYFEEVGQLDAYDSKISAYDGTVTNSAVTGAKIMLLAERDAGKWESLGGLGVSLAIAGSAGLAVGANIVSIAPFIFRASGLASAGFASAEESAEIGVTAGVADVAGVVGIVAIFVQIGAQAIVDLVQTQQNQDAINTMLAYGNTVANQTPDLQAMLQDQVGYQKIVETFIAATLPDLPSMQPPPALPTPPSGLSAYGFYITDYTNNNVGVHNTFNYTTWDPVYPAYFGNPPYAQYGTSFNVASYGAGWFIQTIEQGVNTGYSFFSPSIRYIDPNTGIHYIADRIDKGRFMVSKAPDQVGNNDFDCPADPVTGVTQSPDTQIPTLCKTFVMTSLNIYAFDYASQTLQIPQPPVFATPDAAAFNTDGTSPIFVPQLDSTSATLPCSIRTTSTLPPGLTFTNGALYVEYPSLTIPGSYQFNLVADCETIGSGSLTNYSFGTAMTTQAFTANVYQGAGGVSGGAITNGTSEDVAGRKALPNASPTAPTALEFTYPVTGHKLTFTKGRSTTLTVQTNGGPGTSIVAGANALPPGLTLTDNGNGTATVSGIPTGAAPACSSACAITASAAGLTSATLVLDDAVVAPVLPTIPASQNAAWKAAQNNAATIDGSGGRNGMPTDVPLSWSVVGPLPGWASLTDNGNNIATISGIPPLSAAGQTIPLKFQYSYGGTPGFKSPTFTLNVDVKPPAPVLTVSPSLLFQVGVDGSGTINSSTLSGATGLGGTWEVKATLPTGLTAIRGTTSLVIEGTPANPGDLLIPVQFTDTAGQSITRNVAMMIDQPASLANFPARLVLFVGVPANFILPVTAGFPTNPAGTPGDGLPSTTGANLKLTGNYSTTNGFAVTSTGGALIFKGTPLATASYPLTVSAQTILSTGPVGEMVSQPFTLYVQPAGDVNLDGVVNCADYDLIKAHYGAVIGQPNYLDLADPNRDGIVNILDLAFVQAHLPQGTVCQ